MVRAPDVGFMRAERIPAEGIPPGFWPGAPDLTGEVLSPSDRFRDMMDKVQQYLDASTRRVWVADPEERTVRIFRANGTLALSGEDVLPSFRLPLSEVWV